MTLRSDIRTAATYRATDYHAIIDLMRDDDDALSEIVRLADAHAADGLYEYDIREECGGYDTIRAKDDADAERQLEEWVRDGEYGQHDESTAKTLWVHTYYEREGGEQTRITVQIDPDEPDCIDGEDHDWQSPIDLVGGCDENPGVYGHGGGVTITELCIHCGCERTMDTWAQDPNTGEQGLESVAYVPGKYSREDMIRAGLVDEDGRDGA